MTIQGSSNVIKRNGEEVSFDRDKIINAIRKANQEVSPIHRLNDFQIEAIADMIVRKAVTSSSALNVEDIQDMVETGIMEMRGYEVAQKYVRYRYKRELSRKSNSTDNNILALLDQINENVKQENSNKNPTINSTPVSYTHLFYIGFLCSYTVSWKVRLITSNCCSRLKRLKFTA